LHIGAQSLWTDEAYAWHHANAPNLIDSLKHDTHPPLYFASLHLWEMLTGETEIALRFFSVLPSMMSIALVYQLAKEFVRARGGKERESLVPVLAALMMALADAENYLSQEVRHYTWHVLFAIASMYFFMRWMRTNNSRTLLYWIAFTTLLVYTHFIGAFTGIVEGVYALIFLRGEKRLQAVGALVASAALLSPWLILVGRYQINNRGANWSFRLDWGFIQDMIYKWFSQQWPLMIGLALLGTVTLIYLAPDAPKRTLLERLGVHIQRKPIAPSVLLVLWLILPVVLTVIGNYFIPLLSVHRMSQITPSVALLTALGLVNFRNPTRSFLLAVIVIYGVTTVDFYRPHEPWRQVAQQVSQWALPGELVLSDIDGGDYQMEYYYHRQLRPGVAYRSIKQWRDFEPETYNEEGGLIQQYKSVWLMSWSSDQQTFGWLNTLGFTRTATQSIDWLGNPLTSYRYDLLSSQPVMGYQNGMTLRQAAIHPDTLRVDLWWSLRSGTNALKTDFTTSAFLLDSTGKLVAQYDSYPFIGERPTTSWQSGDVIFDPKTLQVSDGGTLPPGRYSVGVQIYSLQSGKKIPTLDGQPWATVGYIDR
jgi:uncharacterized membrane protein